MGNKVALIYENKEYHISLNGNILANKANLEEAVEVFSQIVKNNLGEEQLAWEEMKNALKALNISELEINETYKNVTLGDLKYFYNTGKAFYIGNGQMVTLEGGYDFVQFISELIAKYQVSETKSLLELCAKMQLTNTIYGFHDATLSIASAVFSYGRVEYDFATGKINKGTVSEKGSFETFKNYILSIVR